jgi:ornithine cyclodeaminase/alanine dehydrogenase-like protein (mu-crystallin family)
VTAPPFHDAAAIARALPPADAVDALEAALRGGLDPEADPARSSVAAARGAGELLVMPSAAAGALGVKLATVAPGNPDRGLPRIQGVYVLFDGETLAPAALLDGIGLTTVRTAAVSALAVRHLAAPDARRLLVFGTGPQARAHVAAMRAVRPIEQVGVVGRDPAKIARFASEIAGRPAEPGAFATADITARPAEPGAFATADITARPAEPGAFATADITARPAEPGAVAEADIVCCCTTAREPLFDGGAVPAGATVVAIGSHEPEAREVDERLAARAAVVVESRASALREAGDVIAAVEAGAIAADDLIGLAPLVRGEVAPPAGAPRLFKSTGMAWEDLVIAAAVHARA